ncbi:MAG: hypothetical protein M3O46_05180 [Myxococcota bacterium]|nr:hypothetical protein [Myxococcota bacterium]
MQVPIASAAQVTICDSFWQSIGRVVTVPPMIGINPSMEHLTAVLPFTQS